MLGWSRDLVELRGWMADGWLALVLRDLVSSSGESDGWAALVHEGPVLLN